MGKVVEREKPVNLKSGMNFHLGIRQRYPLLCQIQSVRILIAMLHPYQQLQALLMFPESNASTFNRNKSSQKLLKLIPNFFPMPL